MLRTESMSEVTMDELQQGQVALEEESSQLKTHMSLVMEILQALLKKEGNPISAAMMEIVSPIHLSDFTSHHVLPHRFHP